MPYSDPDQTDPMILHGVELATGDDASMKEMASCFIEEYFRLGFDAERIMRMFQTRGYAGPNLACQTLGEAEIRRMIDEMAPLWIRRGPCKRLDRGPSGEIRLAVLQSGE